MLDKFLAFGESFDWVTPLVDLYKDLNNGPNCDLDIDRNAGWSAGRIQRLLKRNGFKVWGRSYTDDWITFRIQKAQVETAKRILKKEHIPLF